MSDYKFERVEGKPEQVLVTITTPGGNTMTETVMRDSYTKELGVLRMRYIGGDWLHPVWKPIEGKLSAEAIAQLEEML